MTGEELFVEIGKMNEEFIKEAEHYRRISLWERCKGHQVPLAASVFVTILLAAKEYFHLGIVAASNKEWQQPLQDARSN